MRREEDLPLVVQALLGVEAARARPVAAPAVGPVVVAGREDERRPQRVEGRQLARIEVVGARRVTARLEVAVERREREVVRVEVGEQIRVLGLGRVSVRHVPEQPDDVVARAVARRVRAHRARRARPERDTHDRGHARAESGQSQSRPSRGEMSTCHRNLPVCHCGARADASASRREPAAEGCGHGWRSGRHPVWNR